jgi:hypothetical protein
MHLIRSLSVMEVFFRVDLIVQPLPFDRHPRWLDPKVSRHFPDSPVV